MERLKILTESVGIFERGKVSREAEFPFVMSLPESFEKQAAKQTRQDAHRQEEPFRASGPFCSVPAQTSAWDHAVQVRMVEQILSPGVQYGKEARFRTEMFRVSGYGMVASVCAVAANKMP